MKTVVILDACVLFPLPLRDTLLRIAEKELYRLCFSQEILDETTKNLVKKKRMTEDKAASYQEFMKRYFPESIVEDYESLIPLMTNNPKDRHVLAAAVKVQRVRADRRLRRLANLRFARRRNCNFKLERLFYWIITTFQYRSSTSRLLSNRFIF